MSSGDRGPAVSTQGCGALLMAGARLPGWAGTEVSPMGLDRSGTGHWESEEGPHSLAGSDTLLELEKRELELLTTCYYFAGASVPPPNPQHSFKVTVSEG